MPTIAVTATRTSIPARVGRKQLRIRNEGTNNARFGWESNITSSGAATDGVLLKPDEREVFESKMIDVSGPLFLICATGQTATVSYTEKA
jgi:hypothetical protein